jgi:hypothetical protein
MIVSMSPPESAMALTLAVMRQTNSRASGVVNKQMSKQNPIEIERDGVLSEMAFGKRFNLYPDFSVHPRKGGADLITHQGLRVDIKATRYKSGRLLIHIDKTVEDVDIYVLAIIDGDDVDFVGYIKSADAIKQEYVKDLGHGVGYVIEQTSLTKFKENNGN